MPELFYASPHSWIPDLQKGSVDKPNPADVQRLTFPTLSVAVGKLRGASTRKQRKRAQRLKTDLRERGSRGSPCRSLVP